MLGLVVFALGYFSHVTSFALSTRQWAVNSCHPGAVWFRFSVGWAAGGLGGLALHAQEDARGRHAQTLKSGSYWFPVPLANNSMPRNLSFLC